VSKAGDLESGNDWTSLRERDGRAKNRPKAN